MNLVREWYTRIEHPAAAREGRSWEGGGGWGVL